LNARARNPAVAALLSAMVPGLGQMYNGELAKGALYLVALCVAAVPLSFLAPLSFSSLMIAVLILLALWIWIVVEAARTARRMSAPFARRRYNNGWAYALAAVFMLVGVQALMGVIISKLAVDFFEVRTPAMEPTLLPGDLVVAERLLRNRERVPRGNIIAFVWPVEAATNVLRRVVGSGGDALAMKGKTLYVNGRQPDETYVEHVSHEDAFNPEEYDWQRRYLLPGSDSTRYHPTRDNWGPIVVSNAALFVLADNREAAEDSRTKGFVNAADVYGRVRYVLFSMDATKRVRIERVGQQVH
jgi:signal peptidase I